MKLVRLAAVAAVAAMGLSVGLVDDAAAAKKKPAVCVRLASSANGLTPEISRDLATASLKESASANGLRLVGKASVKCSKDPLLTECKATQKACK